MFTWFQILTTFIDIFKRFLNQNPAFSSQCRCCCSCFIPLAHHPDPGKIIPAPPPFARWHFLEERKKVILCNDATTLGQKKKKRKRKDTKQKRKNNSGNNNKIVMRNLLWHKHMLAFPPTPAHFSRRSPLRHPTTQPPKKPSYLFCSLLVCLLVVV